MKSASADLSETGVPPDAGGKRLMEKLLNKNKLKNIGVRTAGTLAIPVLFTAVILIVCAANGVMILTNSSLFADFVCYAAIVTLTTFALSINLGSGRFDFSLGSMATLSAAASAKITYALLSGGTGSAPLMLVFCLLFGAILGAISGGLYVLLCLPPIITSLGVTLIFEGIIYVLNNGSYIMSEVQNSSMTFFTSNWYLPAILIVVALAAVYFLYDRTKFGYNYKALREGQKVAVNTGIREIPNAVVCYIVCGVLMGAVGFIQAARNTNINTGVLNFGTISIMFTAFLPMFIGGYIGRFSNDKFGYLLAGIIMSLLNSMFAQLSLIGLVDSSTRSIVEAVLLVLFLIFLNNEQTCKDLVTGRLFKRWGLALKKKFAKQKKDE